MRVDELQDKLRVIQDEIIDVKGRLQKEIPTSELVLDNQHWISKRMTEIKEQYDDLLDVLNLIEGKVEEIPSLDETLALLGIAQDATLDASISGTSLRNIFLELSKKGLTLNEALG